jgi:hypothetical protein
MPDLNDRSVNLPRLRPDFFQTELAPAVPIPEHLTGEVQSKLAYVDENIALAVIEPTGDRITLYLFRPPDEKGKVELYDKVQRVVISMVKGAIRPKVQILEDHLDRAVPYDADPMTGLQEMGQISQEAVGIFALGPLVTRLIGYFESRFLGLADSFAAAPYRFPTLIPARYLERVNFFRAFPHSLTFATHLREDLDAIDHFAQEAACDEHGCLNTPEGSFAGIQALLSPAVSRTNTGNNERSAYTRRGIEVYRHPKNLFVILEFQGTDGKFRESFEPKELMEVS